MNTEPITRPAAASVPVRLQPGIYTSEQIPMADYLADPCPVPSLSSGAAGRLLSKSPKHVWWDHPRLGKHVKPPSDTADIGSVAHDLLLGGEGKLCVIDPADYPSEPKKKGEAGAIPIGWTNGAIRAARDLARANGLTPILVGAMAGARLMAAEARRFLDEETELANILNDGQGENTVIAEVDGVWLRTRPDWMSRNRRVMLHYKTTEASAKPDQFAKGVFSSMDYDVAMAFYRHAFELVEPGGNDWEHHMLVQEQTAPYCCSLLSMDRAKWAIADDKVQRAIQLWRKCMRTGKWPGYLPAIYFITPTPWHLAQAEEALQEAV